MLSKSLLVIAGVIAAGNDVLMHPLLKMVNIMAGIITQSIFKQNAKHHLKVKDRSIKQRYKLLRAENDQH